MEMELHELLIQLGQVAQAQSTKEYLVKLYELSNLAENILLDLLEEEGMTIEDIL